MIDILVKIETNTKIEIEVDSNNNVDVNTLFPNKIQSNWIKGRFNIEIRRTKLLITRNFKEMICFDKNNNDDY